MAELLSNCVTNDHQLAEVSSKHSQVLLSSLAPTVNVHEIVHQNVLNWCYLLHELRINLRVKTLNFFSLALCLSFALAFEFGGNLGFVSLVLCLFDILELLNVLINFLNVLSACRVDVLRNQGVWITFKILDLLDELFSFTKQPW